MSRQSAHEGRKVVSPTHRTCLPPGKIPGTHLCTVKMQALFRRLSLTEIFVLFLHVILVVLIFVHHVFAV
jgi:hypothetical protein